jgi:UDP-N-acetylmuramate--alanine ligase
MKADQIKALFFIGIGGIGMSALARFFNKQGKVVAGYDRTETDLTNELQSEGIDVFFVDDVAKINQEVFNVEHTLVVLTPAVPADNQVLSWFRTEGYTILKRSQLLGVVSEKWKAICVAGTHGKTTVSTMTAHLLKQSTLDCHAFLGGISKNYNTNYLQANQSDWVVLEADEFDRSFLQLSPTLALITSMDADHLDIYGDKQQVVDAFNSFVGKLKHGGILVAKKHLELSLVMDGKNQKCYRYALDEEADFYAKNIKLLNGLYSFDLVSPFGAIANLELGVPGLLNVENAVAASSLALLSGVTGDEIRVGLASFKGIKRRFDYWLRSEKFSFIDDYAHHPEEIKATGKSVRALYPNKKIVAVFQPHLFSRTNDFYAEFAQALSLFDEVLLLDIYPARELPVKGVTSALIADLVTVPVAIVQKKDIAPRILKLKPDIVITMGAGDIDKELPALAKQFEVLCK